MTFTKTPPTVAGFYAWRAAEGYHVYAMEVFMCGGIELRAYKSGFDYLMHVKELGGEWCRLVPSEEIARAYYEGMGDFASEDKDCWLKSRAKRVAEGKEIV